MSPQIATREARERPLRAADREGVEQRLRGVLVRPVAGVHDGAREVPREKVRRARARVADHDGVRRHRHEVPSRVEERLALGDGRPDRRERDRVGREAPLGDLEREPRPRGVLEEQVRDELSAQRRDLLDRALVDLAHGLGGVEDEADVVLGDPVDVEEVLLRKGATGRGGDGGIGTLRHAARAPTSSSAAGGPTAISRAPPSRALSWRPSEPTSRPRGRGATRRPHRPFP